MIAIAWESVPRVAARFRADGRAALPPRLAAAPPGLGLGRRLAILKLPFRTRDIVGLENALFVYSRHAFVRNVYAVAAHGPPNYRIVYALAPLLLCPLVLGKLALPLFKLALRLCDGPTGNGQFARGSVFSHCAYAQQWLEEI